MRQEIESKKDEDGRVYKICPSCNKRYYYDEWFAEKSKKILERSPKSRPDKSLPSFWGSKKYCSKKCSEHRLDVRKYCVHCGKEFTARNLHEYRPHKWRKRKFCGRDCSLEYGFVYRLAKRMGITYEQLREELILVAKKYDTR